MYCVLCITHDWFARLRYTRALSTLALFLNMFFQHASKRKHSRALAPRTATRGVDTKL